MIERVLSMNVIAGQPTDGSGKVCIHLFVPDDRGPFTEPHALHQAVDGDGNDIKNQLVAKPTRGRLACDPKRQVKPVTVKGVTTITPRSDDPRAVTCTRCMASQYYADMMAVIDYKPNIELPVLPTKGE